MANDSEHLLGILYTSTEPMSNEPKRCVVVMDRLRAVTFRHDAHKKFTLDQITKIYPIGRTTDPIIRVKVVVVSDTADCIVFHTLDKEFEIYPDVGFVFGDNHGDDGDSGAAIIDFRNWFIGMAIGKQDVLAPPNTLKNTTLNLDLASTASHFSYAQILPAQTILTNLPREENEMLDEDPPCKRERQDESKQ